MPKVEIKDGKTVKSFTPEEQAQRDEFARRDAELAAMEANPEALAAAQQKAQEHLAEAQAATNDLLSDLLGDNNALNVEQIELTIAGQTLSFGIRKLSARECNAVVRRRMRQDVGGKIVPAIDGDLQANIWTLFECVRKNIAHESESPRWVPMWTIEQIAGNAQNKGLIDNPSANAEQLISGLLSHCWTLNPQLNPFLLGRALSQME